MTFLNDNFMLHTAAAQRLYHEFAAPMPIVDYHNHLPPQQIAEDHNFENLTQVWLYGDHYKWRAMRTQGIPEDYCTGAASDWEKFEKWAETAPYTLRNPLYHWSHLELRRYFGITELLSPKTARAIYEQTSEMLRRPEYSVRNLLRKMNVRLLCTTDDPTDSLEWHRKIAADPEAGIVVLPAFRPDKAMAVENPETFNAWTDQLAAAAGTGIVQYEDFLAALKNRHDFFAQHGSCLSDHGLEQVYVADYTEQEIKNAFRKIRSGEHLNAIETLKIKSALLHEFALWDHEKGWVQQFHLGALRNNNTRAMRRSGPDTGWDSIGDFQQAQPLARFLDRLDADNRLAKTILYNVNPTDNELMATMIGNFNDGSTPGKIQFGSAWWFLDQKDGMERQINALSNMGMLSRFVGMLTDSRSFLSYPRHEYFRRTLCNLFGTEIENGELPAEETDWIGEVVRDISYRNAVRYFGFDKNLTTI
ncbi:MAG: glucuronate isomerase [Saprospiraceae bacterium]|nr:glucuronate isomerase [Saprospiraceae bacterium]